MFDKNTGNKIDRLDFGVSLKNLRNNKSPKIQNKLKVKFSGRDLLKNLLRFKTSISKFIKASLNSMSRLKRSFSRSIFFGRGIYFKYISNLALLFIVSFGAFVYLGYDKSTGGFISRYAGAQAASSGTLFNPGGQAIIARKEFRVTQYTIQPGDTISDIAKKYSTADNIISVDSILWANGLKSSSTLKPGMKLDIPPVSGALHTVKKGDTVISIAKKYRLINDKSTSDEIDVVTQQIVDLNELDVVTKLENGQEVKVPELVEGFRLMVPGGIVVADTPSAPTKVAAARSTTPVIIEARAPTGQGFIWPVAGGAGSISQGYKPPRNPGHTAIDIQGNRIKRPLVSMADGTVKFAGYKEWNCNNTVEIVYDNGFSSIYCHMDSIAVSSGQRVAQGQFVGNMGQKGNATGIHVHMVMASGGKVVNPCAYAPFRGKTNC